MFIARVYCITKDPSMSVACSFNGICKDFFVFSLMEPSAFRICGALLLFL